MVWYDDIISKLDNLVKIAEKQYDFDQNISIYEDRHGSWRRRRVGLSVFYEQSVIYPVTSPFDVKLALPNAQIINDIQIVFGISKPSRDFELRLHMNPADSSYQIIRKETGNTGNDYKMNLHEKYPMASRLSFVFQNYTVGDGCTIFVQADDVT